MVAKLFQEEEQKVEKEYRLKSKDQMIKFKSLNRSKDFLKILKKKKINTKYYTIYFDKNSKNLNKYLNISFVMKKKIGNSVIRNKIKRRLKFAIQKKLRDKNIIDINLSYLVFGKSKAFTEAYSKISNELDETFLKINKMNT